jgi:hypothetical protein
LYNIVNQDHSCQTDYIRLNGDMTSVIHVEVRLD